MSQKRKIGIGVCGLADLCAQMGFPYDSVEARKLSRDVIAFINYVSTLSSFELAKNRGSFGAMSLDSGCRYNDNPGFIEQKYGEQGTTHVSIDDWFKLGDLIRRTRLLRNASTTALPPTGRSALVISASTSVEPYFSLVDPDGQINAFLRRDLEMRGLLVDKVIEEIERTGRLSDILGIPLELQHLYKTALEISPLAHLLMVSGIQGVVDESVSKTINLPESSSASDIAEIYLKAHELGLKGVTVFRAGCRISQPRRLAKM